jgi:hypothetical protein
MQEHTRYISTNLEKMFVGLYRLRMLITCPFMPLDTSQNWHIDCEAHQLPP